jgi:microcystin-dependent protein
MSCSNCFNGCAEIVSDQCVKYTGIDIPILGIKNGDSLSYVEQSIIGFLSSTLDGTGIKIDIPQNIICTLVSQYLPTCGDLTVVDLITALIKAACDLQAQVTNIGGDVIDIQTELSTLNGPYSVNCLSGVSSTSGTHNILQATINQLCAFIIDVETNYVQLADIDAIIANYLASLPTSTLVSTKMIPYVAVEYYGSLTQFDASGAGTGDWDKIYICNGLNGTPDKRGRVGVGVITGVVGGALDSFVNPSASPFNPSYSLGQKYGSNSVTLDVTQMPSHTHATTAVITPDPHNHTLNNTGNNANGSGGDPAQKTLTTGAGGFFTGDTNLSVSVTNPPTGGSLPHGNIETTFVVLLTITLIFTTPADA